MIGAHAVILFNSAGRVLAVDGVRAGLPSRRPLGLVWGVLTVLVGANSVLGSFGDPISLGADSLIGDLVVVVAGALLLLASRGRPRRVAQAAAVAAVAGLSLHAQLGFTDPLHGGTATSAAHFLFVAVAPGG